jgi:FLVCR family feline leukemia virus subgroup C receptor-related protein
MIKENTCNKKEGKELLYKLIIVSAAAVSVILLPVLLFYRDKPPKPPSYTASIKREEFKVAVKILATKVSYLLILVALSIFYGSLTVFAAILSTVLAPYSNYL